MPTTREPAVDGVSAEWSSAPCTTAEMELIIHLGLLDMEEDLIDWETELEYEMPPLLPPSSPLVPSSPEGASDSPVPAPRLCPPVPAPRLRPPVSAPRQRPPVPAPRLRPLFGHQIFCGFTRILFGRKGAKMALLALMVADP